MAKDKTKNIHYVDNEKFTIEVTKYSNACRQAEVEGIEKPQMNNYIGSCVLKVAQKLSGAPNFASYSYRDEMISDGIENVFLYLNNFDPSGQEIVRTFVNILYNVKERKQGQHNLSFESNLKTINQYLPQLQKNLKQVPHPTDEIFTERSYPHEVTYNEPFDIVERVSNLSEEEKELYVVKATKILSKSKFDLKNTILEKSRTRSLM